MLFLLERSTSNKINLRIKILIVLSLVIHMTHT